MFKLILFCALSLPLNAYATGFFWYPFDVDEGVFKSIMAGNNSKLTPKLQNFSREKFLITHASPTPENMAFQLKLESGYSKLLEKGLNFQDDQIAYSINTQLYAFEDMFDLIGQPYPDLKTHAIAEVDGINKDYYSLRMPSFSPIEMSNIATKYKFELGPAQIFIIDKTFPNSMKVKIGQCLKNNKLEYGFCYREYIFLNIKQIKVMYKHLDNYKKFFSNPKDEDDEKSSLNYLHLLLKQQIKKNKALLIYGYF